MKKLLFALSLLGLTAFAAAPSAKADDHDGYYRHHEYRHGYYGHHGYGYGHPGFRHRYRHYYWRHGRRVWYYSYGPYGYYDAPGYYGPAYYSPGVNVHIGL